MQPPGDADHPVGVVLGAPSILDSPDAFASALLAIRASEPPSPMSLPTDSVDVTQKSPAGDDGKLHRHQSTRSMMTLLPPYDPRGIRLMLFVAATTATAFFIVGVMIILFAQRSHAAGNLSQRHTIGGRAMTVTKSQPEPAEPSRRHRDDQALETLPKGSHDSPIDYRYLVAGVVLGTLIAIIGVGTLFL